jgi:CII-binding regulator of phage lambda lysogenization HflD
MTGNVYEMELQSIKQKVYDQCVALVAEKLNSLDMSMKELQASANNETKSSAGDKYETGRAMVMLEKEKLASQWEEANKINQFLSQIHPEELFETVESGTLVRCGAVIYFVAVSLGKLHVDGKDVFVISPISPIGQAMLGKRQGDQISFNGRKLVLDELT